MMVYRNQRIILRATLLSAILVIAGCATNLAPVYFMPKTVDSTTEPSTKMALGTVVVTASKKDVGAHITPQNFRVALIETIKRANLFGANKNRTVDIEANIYKASFPGAGIVMTSELGVHYKVRITGDRVLMNESIYFEGKATPSEEFFGSARGLLAFQRTNEGHFTLLLQKIRNSVKD